MAPYMSWIFMVQVRIDLGFSREAIGATAPRMRGIGFPLFRAMKGFMNINKYHNLFINKLIYK